MTEQKIAPVLSEDEVKALFEKHLIGWHRYFLPLLAEHEQAVLARVGAVPIADCWSNSDGDTWRDSPEDSDFLHGLKVGDEYELQASIRSWPERFRVTKAPDDVNDDYEVEPVHIALKGTPAAAVADAQPLAWSYESHNFCDVWTRNVILNSPDGKSNPPTTHYGNRVRNVVALTAMTPQPSTNPGPLAAVEQDAKALRDAVNFGLDVIFDCHAPRTMDACRKPFRVRVWAGRWFKQDFNDGEAHEAARNVIGQAVAAIAASKEGASHG